MLKKVLIVLGITALFSCFYGSLWYRNTQAVKSQTAGIGMPTMRPDGGSLMSPGLWTKSGSTISPALSTDSVYAGNLIASSTTIGRKYINATTYQILVSDYNLSVSSTDNAVTLTLPASTTTNNGFQLIIKDKNGSSETNNITVVGKGSNTIDASSTAVLNSNYSSITLISDGANNWEVN